MRGRRSTRKTPLHRRKSRKSKKTTRRIKRRNKQSIKRRKYRGGGNGDGPTHFRSVSPDDRAQHLKISTDPFDNHIRISKLGDITITNPKYFFISEHIKKKNGGPIELYEFSLEYTYDDKKADVDFTYNYITHEITIKKENPQLDHDARDKLLSILNAKQDFLKQQIDNPPFDEQPKDEELEYDRDQWSR